MNTHQSFERLLSAKPEDTLSQLLALNLAIQSSDKSHTNILYHVLESARYTVPATDPAWRHIYQLRQSVKSRMQILATEERFNLKLLVSRVGYVF